MGVLHGNPFLIASGTPTEPTFPLQRSIRLRSSASAFFNRTPASASNRKTWTWSGWVKRGILNSSGAVAYPLFAVTTGTTDTTWFEMRFLSDSLYVAGYLTNWRITNQVFRDPSAWYHIVLAVDTTQATANDRLKLYVNGVQVTAFSTTNNPTQNADLGVNQATGTYIGYSNTQYFDGYLTEINFIDGQALTPLSFGGYNPGTNVWEARKYSGTYGTNGFYLNFQNPASTGADSSGNSNNWTPNNIQTSNSALTSYDSMLDVPTLSSGSNANFPTLNPLAGQGNGTYSDGNLAYLNGVSATWKSGVASMGVTSGKYYFEYTITAVSNSSNFYLGVAGSTYNGFASYLGRTADSWAFQWNGASSVKTNNDTSTTVSTAGSISVNNVIQVAIDLGTGSIWWGRNDTWVQGDPSAGTGASFTNLTGTILPAFAVYSNGGDKIAANFGQRPFAYTPPSGFKSLNTFNLPEPTIPRGDKYFEQYLYTGNGGGQQVGEIQKPASLFNLDRSVRLRSSAPASFSRSVTVAGNRKTWTWSGWVKRGTLGSIQQTLLANNFNTTGGLHYIQFTNDTLIMYVELSAGIKTGWQTTAVFRDPSVWYHVVVIFDTTQAVVANMGKIYVNGVLQTTTASNYSSTFISQNADGWINASTYTHYLGSGQTQYSTHYFDGYLADTYFIDGQALDPTSFGAYDGNNYWTPKAYTGTYGTNGFHLEFEDFSNNTATTIGKDTSGNVNNWTPTGISVTAGVTNDSMTDVPTLTSADVANFPTLNFLIKGTPSGGTATMSEGNLAWGTNANSASTIATIPIPTSGKWYWEAVVTTQTYNFCMPGIIKDPQALANLNSAVGALSTGYAIYSPNGQKYNNAINAAYMAAVAQNTVMTIAFDADTGSLYFGAGGSWANGAGLTNQTWANAVAAYTGLTTGTYYPAISADTTTTRINFGQRPFSHTPPTGYKALNSFNIAEVVGDVETSDLVRIKSRSATTAALWFNSISGTGKYLTGNNSTAAEATDVNSLIQFNKNGLLIGNNANINTLNATYIADVWKAGDSTVTNTAGSITSQVRANPISGISVVTYTGNGISTATVGHGLGIQPAMVILKSRSLVNNWWIAHKGSPNSWLQLDTTGAAGTGGGTGGAINYQSTFTNSVFGFLNGSSNVNNVNQNLATYVAYCFLEIPGFSKFDSYISNGSSTDGPFVYTGFRPRWVMIKQRDVTRSWIMYDTTRNTFNVVDKYFFMEGLNNNEQTAALLDINSNGFKLKNNNVNTNTTAGQVYIYIAFAENPFKYALAR